MRRLVASALLVFLAPTLRAEDSPALVVLPGAGFAPQGANFRVAFQFSNLGPDADLPFAPRLLSPQDQAHVESAKGECRGEMIFDLALAPGQIQTLSFICPVRVPKGIEPDLDFYRTLSTDDLFTRARTGPAPR